MIELGIKGRQEEIVTEELTASHIGSGTVRVFATPMMIALMEVVEIDRRRIVFRVTAYDEKGLIGEGTHERFVIDVAKFQAKAEEKSK